MFILLVGRLIVPEETIKISVLGKKVLLSSVDCGPMVGMCPIPLTTVLHSTSMSCPDINDWLSIMVTFKPYMKEHNNCSVINSCSFFNLSELLLASAEALPPIIE